MMKGTRDSLGACLVLPLILLRSKYTSFITRISKWRPARALDLGARRALGLAQAGRRLRGRQVRMVAEPQQVGGAKGGAGGGRAVSGVLDMFGCGAGFSR